MTKFQTIDPKSNSIIRNTNLLLLALFQKVAILESLLTLTYKVSAVKSRKKTPKFLQLLQNRIAKQVNVANLNEE